MECNKFFVVYSKNTVFDEKQLRIKFVALVISVFLSLISVLKLEKKSKNLKHEIRLNKRKLQGLQILFPTVFCQI